MYQKNRRKEMGIGDDTAPFNMAMSTTGRMSLMIYDSHSFRFNEDWISYKKVLDALFLEIIECTTKIKITHSKELEKPLEEIKERTDMLIHQYKLALNNEHNYNTYELSKALYDYNRLILRMMDTKGLLVASIEDTKSALTGRSMNVAEHQGN